jgi:hypothetical protein
VLENPFNSITQSDHGAHKGALLLRDTTCVLSPGFCPRTRKLNEKGWDADLVSSTCLISISLLLDSQLDFELTLSVYRINGLGFGGRGSRKQ